MNLELRCCFASLLAWLICCSALTARAETHRSATPLEDQSETHRAPDPSFLLTATSDDFGTYFPTYLANGYVSTMTGLRGTESNLAYMVAYMDYTKEDIARPAAIPGWSGIDYSTGKTTAGEFWLNEVRLDAKSFGNYRQTLDMHAATLTTSYRYTDDSKRSTGIRVTTFASESAPHI